MKKLWFTIQEKDIKDEPFGIRGGGGLRVFGKIVCFPTEGKKIKCLQRSEK